MHERNDPNFRELHMRVQASTNFGECVCICGSTSELGEWQVSRAVPLKEEEQKSSLWSSKIYVPIGKTVQFRYIIGIILDDGSFVVRRWETNIRPRTIEANELTVDRNAAIDIFGNYDGEENVSAGWLSSETVVQFKLFNSPITLWKPKYKHSTISFKITPIDLSRRVTEVSNPLAEDSEQQSNVSDFEASHRWPVVEIAVMKDGDCHFKPQAQFGRSYDPDEFVVLQCQVMKSEAIAYMVDFYYHSPKNDSIPEQIGFCYILPGNIKDGSGVCTMPITGTRHQPVGQLTVSYLIITPLKGFSCSCQYTFANHWKKTRSLDIGHRGAGNARRTDRVENVLENTVASFNYAAKHGADMVELDVQLSKDQIPVIYHDYHICISMRKRKNNQEHELLQVAVKDLTVNQLQRLKLHPAKNESHNYDFKDDDLEDNQPFPTLEHVLKTVDPSVGFNVEIKFPMQLRDGTWEMDNAFELNQYIDTVLRSLLEHCGHRYILLSCFSPDICSMVRLKQNRFPLLFLTQGQTEKYPPYLDSRTSTIQMATFFALSSNILGINVHTEDLLRNPSLIQFVKHRKLVLFCWGEDINHTDIIDGLKKKGVDGVIYDKVDTFISQSKEKENIYHLDSKGSSVSYVEAANCSMDTMQSLPSSVSLCSVGS